jgi:hypothetical protein
VSCTGITALLASGESLLVNVVIPDGTGPLTASEVDLAVVVAGALIATDADSAHGRGRSRQPGKARQQK